MVVVSLFVFQRYKGFFVVVHSCRHRFVCVKLYLHRASLVATAS